MKQVNFKCNSCLKEVKEQLENKIIGLCQKCQDEFDKLNEKLSLIYCQKCQKDVNIKLSLVSKTRYCLIYRGICGTCKSELTKRED